MGGDDVAHLLHRHVVAHQVRIVPVSESRWSAIGRGYCVRFLARRLLAGTRPSLDAAIEHVQPVVRIAVEPEKPIAADRLAVHPDVVVEHDPIAITDAPSPQDVGNLAGAWDQPLAFGVAGLGRGPAQRDLPMEIAVDGARDVATVEDAAVRRDVDDAQVGVVKMFGQPVDADERAGSAVAWSWWSASVVAAAALTRLGRRSTSPLDPNRPRAGAHGADATGREQAIPCRRDASPGRAAAVAHAGAALPALDARFGSGLARRRRGASWHAMSAGRSTASSSGYRRRSGLELRDWRRSSRSTSSRSGDRWGPCHRVAAGAGGSGRARSDRRSPTSPPRRPLRLGVRALAGRSRRAPMRLGLHARAVRRDVRGGFLVDLHRPLADAGHRPRSRAGLRPRVAAPGRGGVSGLGRLRSGVAVAPRGRARSRRAARRTSRRSVGTYAEYHNGPAAGPSGTWSPWYRDWMTGRLAPAGGRARSPSHRPGSASPRSAGPSGPR